MSELNNPAMPYYGANIQNTRPGMTVRQHAANTLRVPMSGDAELDAMIHAARRLDMATAAMQGLIASSGENDINEALASAFSVRCADVLLAASEPKKADPIGCHVCAHAKVENVDVCNSCFKDGKLTRFERRHHHKASSGKACSENTSSLGTANNSEPQPDAEGWIEWKGEECPVEEGTIVDLKFVNGGINRSGMPAEKWIWSRGDAYGYDIIAYRVVKEAAK